MDRYDLKYKPLFTEVSQTKILKIVKHSFSSLFVQTVLAPYTVLTHAEGFSKNSFSSAVSVPFSAFYDNKEFLERFPASQNIIFHY